MRCPNVAVKAEPHAVDSPANSADPSARRECSCQVRGDWAAKARVIVSIDRDKCVTDLQAQPRTEPTTLPAPTLGGVSERAPMPRLHFRFRPRHHPRFQC